MKAKHEIFKYQYRVFLRNEDGEQTLLLIPASKESYSTVEFARNDPDVTELGKVHAYNIDEAERLAKHYFLSRIDY